MNIPHFEDMGNEPIAVSEDAFFTVIARGFVESYVDCYMHAEVPYSGTTVEKADLVKPDPFETLRFAVNEVGLQPSLDTIQYRVHVALHKLWSNTFNFTDGEGVQMRELLQKQFLEFSQAFEEEAKLKASGAN